jgi:hypothetical protein
MTYTCFRIGVAPVSVATSHLFPYVVRLHHTCFRIDTAIHPHLFP